MSHCFFFTKFKIKKEKKKDRRIGIKNEEKLDNKREMKKEQVYCL